jgi:SH3-like domain-containing protein|tara:strand:- start:854 stop:1303 length:450 start_codon:yes stop_codon:yes gene_type:complete
MLKIIIIFLLILFLNSNSISEEFDYFLMLKNNKVNVRFGPSLKSPIKYIYNKVNLPVKIIDKKENFRRITDHKKNSGWIHISQLKKSKSLVTTSQKILFKKPTKYSKPLAKIEKGRLLIVKKCSDNWCIVKTEKFSGWISKDNIWGKIN